MTHSVEPRMRSRPTLQHWGWDWATVARTCGDSPSGWERRDGGKQQMISLGRNIGEQRDYPERVGQVIDEEIRRFLEGALARAS